MGGLGNQLFQYSTGRALSIRLNTELKLDLTFFENPKYQKVFRLDKFNLPYQVASSTDFHHLKSHNNIYLFTSLLSRIGIHMKTFPFIKRTHVFEDDLLMLLDMNNIQDINYYLEGWFGSEDYFIKTRSILIDELNMDRLLSKDNLILQREIKNCNSIALHIRRKDYLTNSHFITLSIDYYLKAIENIRLKFDNPIFYFFSDDIEWVKKEYSSIENAKFVDNNSYADSFYTTTGDIEDLMIMRSCKHNIIANSTFSWWGAWLNENQDKIVIAPQKWYNAKKAQKKYEKGNFLPKTWIKI